MLQKINDTFYHKFPLSHIEERKISHKINLPSECERNIVHFWVSQYSIFKYSHSSI